jgi:hypothetical protein
MSQIYVYYVKAYDNAEFNNQPGRLVGEKMISACKAALKDIFEGLNGTQIRCNCILSESDLTVLECNGLYLKADYDIEDTNDTYEARVSILHTISSSATECIKLGEYDLADKLYALMKEVL